MLAGHSLGEHARLPPYVAQFSSQLPVSQSHGLSGGHRSTPPRLLQHVASAVKLQKLSSKHAIIWLRLECLDHLHPGMVGNDSGAK